MTRTAEPEEGPRPAKPATEPAKQLRVVRPAAPSTQPAASPPVKQPAEVRQSVDPTDPYDLVRGAAQGSRKDYRLEPKPVGKGGQAEVVVATHKPTGTRVAFKRLRTDHQDAVARMTREIEVAKLFCGHDADPNTTWFVMPLATGTAETFAAELKQPQQLRDLVMAVCAALRGPHEQGWLHRDLKPANLLKVDGRWTVADWGLGRRPRGHTTDPRRTHTGQLYGTEGFAAPELYTDAHRAGPPADIYSIGQLVGWILTGTWPQANVPLLPAAGPWRNIVRTATQLEPWRRPSSVDELLDVLARELDVPPNAPENRGQQLLAAVRAGVPHAVGQLLDHAARHPGDHRLYLSVLTELSREHLEPAVPGDPTCIREVVRAIAGLLDDPTIAALPMAQVDRMMIWTFTIINIAMIADASTVLEEATEALLRWDAHWNRWVAQDKLRGWLASLSGEAASVVADVLRRHPRSAEHFASLIDDRTVDPRIRTALRAGT